MCERISWIALPDKTLLYLTTYDLWDTPQGAKVRERFRTDDWWGHAAINFYYEQHLQRKFGSEGECTGFRAPANFPPEIAQAIENGKFRDVADLRMLTVAARAKLPKESVLRQLSAVQDEWDAMRVKTRAARAKLDAVWDKYNAARVKWGNVTAAQAKLDAVRVKSAQLDAVRAKLNAARVTLDATWDKWALARATSSDPFPEFWKLFRNKRNRAKAWR